MEGGNGDSLSVDSFKTVLWMYGKMEWTFVLLWILCVVFLPWSECRRLCGVDSKTGLLQCLCYSGPKQVLCNKRELGNLPWFYEIDTTWSVDLSGNMIRDLDLLFHNENTLVMAHEIDLRNNPLICSHLPPLPNIVTDCRLFADQTVPDWTILNSTESVSTVPDFVPDSTDTDLTVPGSTVPNSTMTETLQTGKIAFSDSQIGNDEVYDDDDDYDNNDNDDEIL